MFFKAKSGETNGGKAQKPGQIVKEVAQHDSIKWLLTSQDEIEESLLDAVAGGVNPQPLPPRGDDFRKLHQGNAYIGETEKL